MKMRSPKSVSLWTNLSRPTVDRLVANDDFPKPVKLSKRRIAYVEGPVIKWMMERAGMKIENLDPIELSRQLAEASEAWDRIERNEAEAKRAARSRSA